MGWTSSSDEEPGNCLQVQLPGILADIEKALGRDIALRVAAAAGGRRMHFLPKRNLTENNWLVHTVGFDLAAKIADALNIAMGVNLDVPMGTASAHVSAIRDRRCLTLHMLRNGCSTSAIAMSLKISERAVRRLKRSLKQSGELS